MAIRKTLALFGAGALLLTSCTAAPAETGEMDIVIGAIAPLSGDAVGLGIPMQGAALLAEAEINEAWADSGMTFTIEWEDGQCSGQGGASAIQKLVNVDGHRVILGPTCTGETLAAAPIAEPVPALLMSPSASGAEVTDAGEYVYRTWPSDMVQGVRLAELASELGYESVGLVYAETDYAAGIAEVFQDNFDGEVVAESFLSDAVDYKTELTKLKNEEVDVYMLSVQTDVEADVILKQMQDLGIEGPFILNDAAGTHQPTLDKYAEYLEGSYTATFAIDEESDAVLNFMAHYEERFGEEVSFLAYAASYYETTWMLAEAVAEVGSDPVALKEYFDNFKGHNGITGTLRFDENGDLEGGHAIFQIQGGSLVLQD